MTEGMRLFKLGVWLFVAGALTAVASLAPKSLLINVSAFLTMGGCWFAAAGAGRYKRAEADTPNSKGSQP